MERETAQGIVKPFPLYRLFPNMVTLMGLCAGLSSIRFALDEKWEMAVSLVIIAAFIDGMDGRLARLLKSTSSFGAQLDSLADFLSFGIAPAILVYLWQLHTIPTRGLGWAFVLFFGICCAVRLARFNTDLAVEKPLWAESFFVGVPAPAGAMLALIPMMLSFQLENMWFFKNPLVVGIYMTIIAILMASRIPTFSAKKCSVAPEFASIVLMAAGVLMASFIIEPWITVPALGVIYVSSIPLSILAYYRKQHSSLL